MKQLLDGPVAIGGVGGSGTRVVAEVLKCLGFYLGSLLNSSLDNLWFTLLFKRPDWFQGCINGHPDQIKKGLTVFAVNS